MVKVDMTREELENYLYFILDKVEDCYKREVEQAVKRFLNEDVKG